MRGLPDDRALRDMKAAVAYLRSRPDVDGAKIGSVGWCMGGGLRSTWRSGSRRWPARSSTTAISMTDPATIASLKVPLLGNFGGQDQGIPVKDVQEFEAAAQKAGKSVDFKIYPDAGHGFASSKDPKVYRPADAKDADARTDAFFGKVLERRVGAACRRPGGQTSARPYVISCTSPR